MEKDIKIHTGQEGQFLGVAGGNYRIVVRGEETDNNFAVIEMIVPPGGGPPPHSHPFIQETFYVVEGEIEFKTEAGKKVIGKGGFVNIPLGGAVHCFKNNSQSIVKLLCTVMPAGLEKLFETIGTPTVMGEFPPIPEMTDERKALLKQLDEEYHQTIYPQDYLD
ncbi:cupin [Chryseobacterium sp. IHB B 17019]|jgi:quercetin dioxygenase-like cupin family protein|uniref:cupin domain-containing protein n=1 Tax=Chryseobacterium sp. IHB B 17019 TaxID=1721091 RepID=UPI00071F5D29|nr:cupin domain-containing protein [Chryseobacterium sp. IHB B 17019]ALR30800.1 cupin [Chryseobacterium sp. IHB B 17019]